MKNQTINNGTEQTAEDWDAAQEDPRKPMQRGDLVWVDDCGEKVGKIIEIDAQMAIIDVAWTDWPLGLAAASLRQGGRTSAGGTRRVSSLRPYDGPVAA